MQPTTVPQILLTRPNDGAVRFCDLLRRELCKEVEIILSPLTRIDWVENTPDVEDVKALVFTSANGVRGFVRLCARRDIPVYTVGDATARFAQEEGMHATSCRGTAQTLIARILADGQQGPTLHVRGAHSRGDVAKTLSSAGCETRDVVVYRQTMMPLTPEAKDLFRRENPVIVPLFSPRGAAQFVKQYHGRAPVLVAAISKEVAEVAREIDPERIVVAQRPDGAAMVGAVKCLLGSE